MKPRAPSQVAEPISATNGSSRSSAAVADPEEPGSARPAQELPPGAGQQVAAHVVDVDGELADGLGGVQQVQGAGVAGDAPDLRRRD